MKNKMAQVRIEKKKRSQLAILKLAVLQNQY